METNKEHNINKDIPEHLRHLDMDEFRGWYPGKPRNRKVKIYDFRRPDKFSKDQIRTLQMMHETFARLLSVSLSARLRSKASVHVASVDQLTYEEFIRSIPNPTTLAVFNMDPLRGSAVLEIDPSITFSCIDRLFGGGGESPIIIRNLSDIEISAMEGIIDRMLGCLGESWSTILDLHPIFRNIETNPQFALIVPHHEMVVLITLEAMIGEVEGMINLCIPYMAIESIIPRLSAKYLFGPDSKLNKKRSKSQNLEANNIKNLKLDTEVYFGTDDLSLKDINDLKKGILISLPDYDSCNCFLRAGSSIIYKLKQERDKKNKPVKPFHYDVIEQRESFLKEDLNLMDKQKEKQEEEIIPKIKSVLNDFESAINVKLIDFVKKKENSPVLPSENSMDLLDQIPKDVEKLRSLKNEPLIEQTVFELARIKGIAYTSEVIEKALGSPEAIDIINRLNASMQIRPFDFIRRCDPGYLLSFIQNEHPQTIALILSFLDSSKAALILGGLSPQIQADIARRIATMQRTTPDVLREVERVLERRFSKIASEYASAGGIDAIVEVLSQVDRGTEKIICDELEKQNPELLKEIRKRMFIFDDISSIDDDSIKKIIKEINKDDMILAFKGAEKSTQEAFYRNMSEDETSDLKGKINSSGPKRLRDVEEAQQKIVNIIRKMEESGEIMIAREGETI